MKISSDSAMVKVEGLSNEMRTPGLESLFREQVNVTDHRTNKVSDSAMVKVHQRTNEMRTPGLEPGTPWSSAMCSTN